MQTPLQEPASVRKGLSEQWLALLKAEAQPVYLSPGCASVLWRGAGIQSPRGQDLPAGVPG